MASGSVPWQFVFVAVSAVHGSHGSFARAVPGGSVPVCGSVRGFPVNPKRCFGSAASGPPCAGGKARLEMIEGLGLGFRV